MSIIKFSHVSKHFTLAHQRTLKEMVHALFKRQKTLERVKALTDVSFEISQGQSVGVVGRNGAGKSTLLKLIAGVTSPTHGTIEISEQVYPLIELGAGFHPELTGKENIFLNGVILGMSEAEVEYRYQSIVDFSELHDFMDVPVKYYSSGMYARLAFSVATCKTPKILLLDEILAVGDVKFQQKCLMRMKDFKAQGASMILVAHGGLMMKEFCEKVIYLKSGHLEFYGNIDEGLKLYEEEQ
ncbi:MAG: ABC transporter ATP-binding protein [Patescibacteria group bacterium]